MGHNHNHSHNHAGATKNIAFAFFINLLFSIIELVGGLLTNSVAILSDALHDFGDSISLALAWYLERKSKLNTSEKYSFGYKRFSLLGAIINGLILFTGSVIVIIEGVKRILKPEDVNAEGMLYLAILGIVANGVVYLRGRKSTSLNERVVTLHFLEDVLGWVAVLISSIVMIYVELPILDSILSIAISLFIMYNVFGSLGESVKVFLDKVPEMISIARIKKELNSIDGVAKVGDVHIWSLDSEYNLSTVQVVVEESIITLLDTNNIVKEVKKVMKMNTIAHTTVEVQPMGCNDLLSCPIDQ